MSTGIQRIYDYWFGEIIDGNTRENRGALWYGGGENVDTDIRQRFESDLGAAAEGKLDHWAERAEGRLALIILLDQFPLNMYRGSAKAYAFEDRAEMHCLDGLASGQDVELSLIERCFFYMPLQHAEDMAMQNRSVACYQALLDGAPEHLRDLAKGSLDYAVEHRDIVARFGRFPHRNRVLGREPSAEETAWLEDGGATYGQ